ncbi:fimbria biosynthesis transcriptional regulator FimZ, partial [Escherichia coli]|uniref:fimbria biosynthesis transcriptional regulator FimZ n=1 Tax=Escherichia coli TaxID=562 RepID=UPI0039B860D7
MKPTSVIIMDTHPIIRMSIEVLLQKNSELQIVLKTDDYRITIDYLRTRPVDLIIMDIDLPGTDGFTFLKRIKQIQSTVKVLFLSSKSECFYAGRAIQAGANGFVSKCNDQNDIFHAVQMILSGYTFFPSETLNYIKSNKCSTNSSTVTVLSNREVTIGFAPIFPDICYHLTHYKPAAADIPVASVNPAHYADAIRYNA